MESERLLTVAQVADQLQVHVKTVQGWLRSGEMIGVRLGDGPKAEWRVTPDDLRAFIAARRSSGSGD